MAAPLGTQHGYRRVDHVLARDATIAYRLMATIAAAVPTVIGLVALARIDWSNGGIHAPFVQSAGMAFTPVVAIATTAFGLIAIFTAASPDRATKLVVGTLFLCAAITAFAAKPSSRDVILDNDHGWLFGIVGAVILLAAVLMSWTMESRVVETDERF